VPFFAFVALAMALVRSFVKGYGSYAEHSRNGIANFIKFALIVNVLSFATPATFIVYTIWSRSAASV
jgi:hypothetical protein